MQVGKDTSVLISQGLDKDAVKLDKGAACRPLNLTYKWTILLDFGEVLLILECDYTLVILYRCEWLIV